MTEIGHSEVLLAVVADGAGSAERSAEGAELACLAFQEIANLAVAWLSVEHLKPDFADTALQDVRRQIDQSACDAGERSAAFACTLVAAVVGAEAAVFLQVGDGAAVLRTQSDHAWRLALTPQRGEFANTTIFVTRPDAPRHLKAVRIDRRVTELALMTDGVEFLAIQQATRTPHGPFMDHVLAPLRAERSPGSSNAHIAWLETFLDSPAVNSRQDDDKTLLLATRLPPPP